MTSLKSGYRAVVIGASGGIGSAIADLLEADPECAGLVRLSRRSEPSLDLCDEGSIATAAANTADRLGSVDLVFNAAGALVIDDVPPEKAMKRLDPDAMARHFQVNAIGPALLVKHFTPLLPKETRGLFGSLSARVGSIGDNRLGGWISYRAAKAAQNQIVKTASVELARTRPHAVLAALHPGTVATPLSDPFAAKRERLTPHQSAAMLLHVLDALTPEDTGGFFAYDGSSIEW